jgi:hypothetical protein
MAGKRFTHYYRDPAFRAAVYDEFARADAETKPGVWIIYAIHDPTRPDPRNHPNGLIVYVGQSKEFGTRVRKRMRNAGTAVRRPTDRIDGLLYDIMRRGSAPRFRVLDRSGSAVESLVSETNFAKQLIEMGYPILNQWAEQMFAGTAIDRYTIPHTWLWPITVEDAIGSQIDLVLANKTTDEETVLDLSPFPPRTRLQKVKEECLSHMRSLGHSARVSLLVR